MIISVKEVRNFLISVVIPLIVGCLSGFISRLMSGESMSVDYSQLIKPGFAPPSFIFPIVWTLLYVLIGISAYKVIKNGYELSKVKDAMFYYWLQLLLNFLWSVIFFGLDLRLTALVTLITLIIVVLVMTFKFYKIDKKAAYLNIPYIIWMLYAALLNYVIWIINK